MQLPAKALFTALVVSASLPSLSAGAAPVTPTRYTTDQSITTSVKQDVIIGKDSSGNLYSNTVSDVSGGAIRAGTVGGKTASGTVDTFGTSTFNLSGGIVEGAITSHGQSFVNVSAGTAQDTIFSTNNSTVIVTGGKVANGFTTYDKSEVDIYAGTVVNGIYTFNQSNVNIFGGTIKGDLIASNHSVFDIYGGDFNGVFAAGDNAIFNIHGDNLKFKLVDGYIHIKGTLNDGSSINATILDVTNSGASFNLIPAPEASQTAVMGFGVLGVASMIFFARKRRSVC